ncbi:MAG TPA: hypothetical protein VK061_02375 [Bacillota bacterium]|nr:hypothetical protein [Bacillota bacterium]
MKRIFSTLLLITTFFLLINLYAEKPPVACAEDELPEMTDSTSNDDSF